MGVGLAAVALILVGCGSKGIDKDTVDLWVWKGSQLRVIQHFRSLRRR